MPWNTFDLSSMELLPSDLGLRPTRGRIAFPTPARGRRRLHSQDAGPLSTHAENPPVCRRKMPGRRAVGEDFTRAEEGEADVLDRHKRLAVRVLERPVLPPHPSEERLAGVLRGALRDRGGQQLLLPASLRRRL